MTTYSKYNIVYRLQKWLDSVWGQTFLNYAYSWGASIVILGVLFHFIHVSFGTYMLVGGLLVEAVVFFLYAFDRPFDKTEDGRELPPGFGDETDTGSSECLADASEHVVAAPVATTMEPAVSFSAPQSATVNHEQAAEMSAATRDYVDALKQLTETLGKVSEQSSRLSADSQEMENLNRTLTGICKIYELQLKSAGSQMGTIDRINDQTRVMAEQIEQLNKIYARMIEAMTTNMKGGVA